MQIHIYTHFHMHIPNRKHVSPAHTHFNPHIPMYTRIGPHKDEFVENISYSANYNE